MRGRGKLIGMLAVATFAVGALAVAIDTSTIKAGDLWIRRDKGYTFVDDEPIPGNEQYFKAFDPAAE